MDATRFDAITKAWVSIPRRRLLGGLAAGAVAPLLGLGGREASAQTCQRGSDCPTGQACVHKTCVPKCGDPFTCRSTSATGCGKDCLCTKKPGGGGVCGPATGVDCATVQGCKKQRDCPVGQICASGCCGEGEPRFFCAQPCFP
jgi:hypothetical protein